MKPALRRVLIMASGNGSNAQVLLDFAEVCDPRYQVVAVLSDHPDARVLERAASAGVRTEILERQPGETRDRYDIRLERVVAPYQPDLIVLAGWMRILTGEFCSRFKIVNLHPAKPGMFPGASAIGDAFAAFQAGGIAETGVMVHWVPDAGVDTGPVIRVEGVPIVAGDTLDSLADRVHAVEHRLLPLAVGDALRSLKCSDTTPLEVP
ncbi:MAG: phosphoribosylglycinamide formyltransferase [Acidimicrobiales bacterium]